MIKCIVVQFRTAKQRVKICIDTLWALVYLNTTARDQAGELVLYITYGALCESVSDLAPKVCQSKSRRLESILDGG